jgi:hypothetical protein
MSRRRFKFTTFALATAALLASAGIVYGYAEETPRAHAGTPPNSGCLQTYSSLSHGTGTAPMSLHVQSFHPGKTAQSTTLCNHDWPADTTTVLAGQTNAYVIKLIVSGSQHDIYSLCTASNSGLQSITTQLNYDVSYPSPPCGPGWYALVVCMTNVTLAARPPGSPAVITSTFSANAINASQCNVSPHWHPAGPADPTSSGPDVHL